MSDFVRDKLQVEAEAAASLLAEINSDDDQLNTDVIDGETSLMEAIESAYMEMLSQEVIVSGCKDVAVKLKARQDKAQRRFDTIKGLIEQALVVAGVTKIRTSTATFTIKNMQPRTIVTDEAAIPSQFWKPQPPKLDKAAISSAIRSGDIVPGVTVANKTTTLQIRRA